VPPEFFNDITGKTLVKALDGTIARHRALANNIANADTPGYHRKDVSFHDQLRSVLAATTEGASSVMENLEKIDPQIAPDTNARAGYNGNSVTIETEMGELAKNTLEYETDIQLLSTKLKMLRSVISEGRR
jgi:flagellar basal-body rod protein FlgB